MKEPTREELALMVDQLRLENSEQAKMIEALQERVDDLKETLQAMDEID
jgi:hypothetical protein